MSDLEALEFWAATIFMQQIGSTRYLLRTLLTIVPSNWWKRTHETSYVYSVVFALESAKAIEKDAIIQRMPAMDDSQFWKKLRFTHLASTGVPYQF